ncbi:cysteine desulfurase family protein, partial [Thermodesulfobacteriota bacterium]
VDKGGNLDVDILIDSIRSDTNIVTLMAANNETGVIFPVGELSKAVKKRDPDIIFHTDATQYIGKLPINLQDDFQFIDLLSFSGHKIHGPKGVGGLFVREETKLVPFLYGGQQENGLRAGTENVPGIVGLAKACELAETHMSDMQTVRSMRDHLEACLLNLFPSAIVNGDRENRLPNTLNIAFDMIEGEDLLYQLQNGGISASNGSACSTGSLDYSHVLRSMKVPYQSIAGSVRFSLSRFNTTADVSIIIETIQKILHNTLTAPSIEIT